MEKHTIRLTAIIGLGWLCFLPSYVGQKSTAKNIQPNWHIRAGESDAYLW